MSETTSFSKLKLYLTSAVIATTVLWTVRSLVVSQRMKKQKEKLKYQSDIQS